MSGLYLCVGCDELHDSNEHPPSAAPNDSFGERLICEDSAPSAGCDYRIEMLIDDEIVSAGFDDFMTNSELHLFVAAYEQQHECNVSRAALVWTLSDRVIAIAK